MRLIKDYGTVFRCKRFTQKQLFKKITKVKTMLGLGGPEKYLEVVPEHKNCVLVDFNPADALVRRNSLIGEFDLLTNSPAERSPLNFVDCDFCKSIINNGADIFIRRCSFLQLETSISLLVVELREEQLSGWQRISQNLIFQEITCL